MSAATTMHPIGQRRLLWLVGALSVGGTIAAGTFTGVGSPVAAAFGVLVALGTVGWSLWRTAPDPAQAKSNLGTGLLVSIVVAAAIGSAQFAIDDRRRLVERERQDAAQLAADRENLRMTVGLQKALEGIDLGKRDLTGFYFAGKNLKQARFEQAILVKANLERADLRDAHLRTADLRQATLFEAVLVGADVKGADLRDAQLTGADLRSADLRRARLGGAKLQAVRLRKAFLAGADLRGADLRAADLSGANLSGAQLRGATLRGAIVDSATRWPAGFDPRGAGVRRVSRP